MMGEYGLSLPRVVVYAGHYGSGKTTLAVQTALALRARGGRVLLADLDIVNPYFRTRDHRARLEAAGVRLIASPYAGSNAELPGFPPEAAAAFDDTDSHAVLDVGGDDRGALALGRYAARLNAAGAAVLLVVNAYRPMTARPEEAAAIREEIERAARVRFTGLVNNSNLGAGTAAREVLDTRGYIGRVSELTGLPLLFTAARAEIAAELDGPVMALEP
ncbi:MAG: hypothetical protein FWG93_05025 [Oscillospiraceae bacterium]|nr:hypothetical protein [Oscillospiraceae bacterium]